MIYRIGNKVIFKITCAVIALCLVMPSLSSCALLSAQNGSISISDYLYSGKGEHYHCFSKNSEKIAESENIRLYFDKESTSVAVFDAKCGNSFYSVPTCDSMAAVLSLTAVGKNGTFLLNSQDNSVAFGTSSYELTDHGIRVLYRLSNDGITAKKAAENLLSGELLVTVAVEYILSDGALFTKIDCSDIFVSDGYTITELSVGGDFGAMYENSSDVLADLPENMPKTAVETEQSTHEKTEQNSETPDVKTEETQSGGNVSSAVDRDFIFVPDGCGAVMYTDMFDVNTNEISLEVYGDDAGTGENGTLSACFPAFGIKRGNSAFVSIIDSAAELATITASRASGDNSKNSRAGAIFRITPCETVGKNTYFGERYNGEILICTKFLSGKEATYIGMAAACREELTRIGVLSGRQKTESEAGLNISFLVSSDGTKKSTVSDFGQITDTLTLLKAKGVDSVNLILRGALSGGLVRDSVGSFSFLRTAGGSNGYKALCSYAEKQKFNIFIGCTAITQSGSLHNTATDLSGSIIKTTTVNSLYPYFGEKYLSAWLVSADKTVNNIIGLINGAKKYSFDGYCVSDAANILSSDSSATRVQAADFVSQAVSSLATQKKLMLEGSNFTCLSRADSLINIPFETQLTQSEAYSAVPFLQAMLHSSLTYSGSPINTAPIPTLLMLKYIEYGAALYFEWSLDSSNSLLYYDNSLADAVKWYVDIENRLSDLSDYRIVSHCVVAENVYRTGYDCGSLIYVNYNNYSVNIGNISVPAYGFFRVN